MAKERDTIHVLLTGGRIDSVWDGKIDEIVVSKHSFIPQYVASINLYPRLTFSEICMKDSRALTHEDRARILQAIESSDSQKIMITHGTHTMPDSIRFIKEHIKRQDQTVVFTGSTTPLKDFAFSDAAFNLGFALGKVQELPAGIYLCMEGKTLTASEVEHDIQNGNFYNFFPEKQ